MREVPSIYLLDIIGHESADKPFYCSPEKYWAWEINTAIPALLEKGYVIHELKFSHLERDSFGPLSRGILVSKDKVLSIAWYG
jgi:hypothetical protein